MGGRRCSSSFFRQDNRCWESLFQFISERECRDSTQNLSDAKDLVSSSDVLGAHIQKQSYSPPWEVYYVRFNLAMSFIIDELDDQSFRGPVKFLKLYATLRGNVHVFLGRRSLDYTVLQGIDGSKSLLATALVRVVIALILTLVSAHRGGSWTTQHKKKWAVIHAHSFSRCQWWWWKVHPSLVLLLPLTCQAPWLGQVEQVR